MNNFSQKAKITLLNYTTENLQRSKWQLVAQKAKIITVNVVIIIFLLLSFEIICHFLYYKLTNQKIKGIKDFLTYYAPQSWDIYKSFEPFKSEETFFPERNKKRPVVTIGCSFTEGVEGYEKTFASVLNRLSGRKTYNRGRSCTGTHYALYQLQNKEFKNDIPDAEYVIYTYIDPHIGRNFTNILDEVIKGTVYQPVYRLDKNKKLYLDTNNFFSFLYPLYSVKIIMKSVKLVQMRNERKSGYPLLTEMVKEMNSAVHFMYPEAKFVFLEYPTKEGVLPKEEVEKIKSMGIIYLNAQDFIGDKITDAEYLAEDGFHPNLKAYEKLSSGLIKKLNL